MKKDCVIVVTNSFDERIVSVWGTYTWDEAIEKISEMYDEIINESKLDDMYDGSDISKLYEYGNFTITWNDDSWTDYNVCSIEELK